MGLGGEGNVQNLGKEKGFTTRRKGSDEVRELLLRSGGVRFGGEGTTSLLFGRRRKNVLKGREGGNREEKGFVIRAEEARSTN